MKIKSSMFEHIDIDVEKKGLLEALYDEKIYDYIASLYVHMTREKFNVKVSLYFSHSKPSSRGVMARRATRRRQIQKYIRICVMLGVSFDFYMRAVFDIYEGWDKSMRRKFLPFDLFITEQAMDSFKQYDKSRVSGGIKPITHYEEFVPKEIKQANVLRHSIRIWYDRLGKLKAYLGSLEVGILANEFEVLIRAGFVNKVYSATLDWLDETDNTYMAALRAGLRKELGKIEVIKLGTLKRQILEDYEGCDFKEYL